MERTKDEVEKILIDVLIENRNLQEELKNARENAIYWYNEYIKNRTEAE